MNVRHTVSNTVVEVSFRDIIRLLLGQTLRLHSTRIAVRMASDRPVVDGKRLHWDCMSPDTVTYSKA